VGREDFVWFDVRTMLIDMCEMYHPLLEESGSSASVRPGTTTHYFGNRELLGQAVSNLLDNALKYASGSVIELGAAESDDEVQLWVADRGPGIPQNERANAVQKYHRLERARTSQGSGLGLAMVNAVARLHGGHLVLGDHNPGLRATMVLKRFDAEDDGLTAAAEAAGQQEVLAAAE
jgi:signal transduction histidine kinase